MVKEKKQRRRKRLFISRILIAAALIVTLMCFNVRTFAADIVSSEEYRLAGYYVCFEDGETMLRRGILTLDDGFIKEISGYEEDLDGVVYLDPECVILPGLIDLHSHIDYNGMQLWFSDETDGPWDNRFEWRKSSDYKEVLKGAMTILQEQWGEEAYSNDMQAYAGDVVEYFAEMQAAAGGTTLIQGVNDTGDTYDVTESHDKLRLVRSTALGEDLMREEGEPGIESITQLFVPDAVFDIERPETYLPPIDTSSWKAVHAADKTTGEDLMEAFLNDIREHSQRGYLIHLSEGRAGNLTASPDPYSKLEYESFKAEIEAGVENGDFTAEDVRNAHIGLIHACAIDLSLEENRTFLEEYGISLIWSPVSNLLMYDDTPDFYPYMNATDLKIALGSDWSPSGSKTVWEEAAFVYNLVQSSDEKADEKKDEAGDETSDGEKADVREKLLLACTLTPAEIVGDSRLGNIAEGAFADLFIMRTDKDIDGDPDPVLDAFVTADDRRVEGVVIGGRAICGEKAFLTAYTQDESLDQYGAFKAGEDSKMFLVPELFGDKSATELYEIYETLMTDAHASISGLRSTEDEFYVEEIKKLTDEVLKLLAD